MERPFEPDALASFFQYMLALVGCEAMRVVHLEKTDFPQLGGLLPSTVHAVGPVDGFVAAFGLRSWLVSDADLADEPNGHFGVVRLPLVAVDEPA